MPVAATLDEVDISTYVNPLLVPVCTYCIVLATISYFDRLVFRSMDVGRKGEPHTERS
jgi:hypothetical protein